MAHPIVLPSYGGGPTYPSWVPLAFIGDEVASIAAPDVPLGTVTDIHGYSFGDGPGDTITVLPAAVTLSSGDRYPVADLVLLRRADQ